MRETRPAPPRPARILGIVIAGALFATAGMAAQSLVLADPTAPIEQAWMRLRFKGETDYRSTALDGVAAIRAVGRGTASGLYREVDYRVADYPWLEWTWRVDRLQQSADIRDKHREDFAAAIFLIFGRADAPDPDAPTLLYVWTSGRVEAGSIIANPHHPRSMRDVVVRSGAGQLGQWMHERRNVVEDFRSAFHAEPPERVGVLALFTDNDQTGEPVEAYYGAIAATSR